MVLRLAGPGDADHAALAELAALESRALPPGPHLLAEQDGTVAAALSLRTGDVVADPFRRTAELCALLRCHAGPVRLPRPPQALSPEAPLSRALVRR